MSNVWREKFIYDAIINKIVNFSIMVNLWGWVNI